MPRESAADLKVTAMAFEKRGRTVLGKDAWNERKERVAAGAYENQRAYLVLVLSSSKGVRAKS